MTTPEADPYDVAEQGGTEAVAGDVAVPGEADVYDAAEQSADAVPTAAPVDPEVPLEADAYDAAEQAAVVPMDEDEQR